MTRLPGRRRPVVAAMTLATTTLATMTLAAMLAPAFAEDAAPAPHGGDAATAAPPPAAPAATATPPPVDDAPVVHDRGPALPWHRTVTAGPQPAVPRPAVPRIASPPVSVPIAVPRNAIGVVMPPRPQAVATSPGLRPAVGIAPGPVPAPAIHSVVPAPPPPLPRAAINGTAMGQRLPSSPVTIGGPAREHAGVINGTLIKPKH